MPPLWLLGASIFVFSTSFHIRIPRRAYLRCGDGTNLFDWSLHWGMTWLGCPASQAEIKNWILTIHCNFFVKNIWGGNVYWEKAWLVRLEYEDERGGKVHCHKWEKPLKSLFLPPLLQLLSRSNPPLKSRLFEILHYFFYSQTGMLQYEYSQPMWPLMFQYQNPWNCTSSTITSNCNQSVIRWIFFGNKNSAIRWHGIGDSGKAHLSTQTCIVDQLW